MGAVPQRPARRWLQTLVLLLLAAGTAGAIRFIQRDPAADVVRVRLAITSRASSVIVTTQGAAITNASVEDVNGGLRERAVFEGGRVGYTGNIPGLEVEASFRVTLARVRGSGVTFRTDRRLSLIHI